MYINNSSACLGMHVLNGGSYLIDVMQGNCGMLWFCFSFGLAKKLFTPMILNWTTGSFNAVAVAGRYSEKYASCSICYMN
jgi:hypothetical protein